jgi:hypothetical protein
MFTATRARGDNGPCPVKSMRRKSPDLAQSGWHGPAGDRRLKFRRMDKRALA